MTYTKNYFEPKLFITFISYKFGYSSIIHISKFIFSLFIIRYLKRQQRISLLPFKRTIKLSFFLFNK